MQTRPALFMALILLMMILACVVPGAQPASVPAPTVDSRLDRMVAETVSAAIALTEQAPTPMPPPTAQPTIAPTVVVATDGLGSTLTSREDGNTLLFVDEFAGYEVIIPVNWLAVRINQQEYLDAVQNNTDPNIQKSLLSVMEADPATFRLLALDVTDGHIQNEIVTNVNFIWDQGLVVSFDSDEDLQKIAEDLPASVEGLTVSTIEVVIPPAAATFGMIKSEIGGFNASGIQVSLYQIMAVFKLKTGTLLVTFTTEKSLSETTLPDFVEMLDSIKFNQ